jgi:hypothetical protein
VDSSEFASVTLDSDTSLAVLIVDALEPQSPERRSGFVGAVVVAECNYVVGRRAAAMAVPGQGCHAMRPEQADPVRHSVIIADDHPTLADGKFLLEKKLNAAQAIDRSDR